jgi:paxillin
MAQYKGAPVPLGTYIGKGIPSTGGAQVAYTIVLKDKKLAWLDYKSDSEAFHSEGYYTVEDNVLKYTVGGLPGQLRVGDEYVFNVKPGVLERAGVEVKYGDFEGVEARQICAKCENPIVGAMLKVGNDHFHKDCFTCDGCGNPLVGKHSKTPDGKRLCPDCVPKKYCETCKKQIDGPATGVGGKHYHPECFKCDSCSTPLAGEFFQKGGKILCKSCLNTAAPGQAESAGDGAGKKAKFCVACGKKIDGEVIVGDKEDYFHPDCFRCADCNEELGEFVIDPNRKFKHQKATYVCGPCNEKNVKAAAAAAAPAKKLPKCYLCKKECDNEKEMCVSLNDGTYIHWACMKCCKCGKNEDAPEAKAVTLLRSKVLAVEAGTYSCNECLKSQLKQGQYVGEGPGEGGPDAVTRYAVQLLENGIGWFDWTSKNKINTSSWHVEGAFEEKANGEWGSSRVCVGLQIKVNMSTGGPFTSGSVVEMDVKREASGEYSIVYQGVSLPFQSGEVVKPPPVKEYVIPAATGAGSVEALNKQVNAEAAKEGKADAVAEVAIVSAKEATFTLTLAELKDASVWKARGVDPACREQYLSTDEFAEHFKVTKGVFEAMPKWKKDKLKKEKGLF